MNPIREMNTIYSETSRYTIVTAFTFFVFILNMQPIIGKTFTLIYTEKSNQTGFYCTNNEQYNAIYDTITTYTTSLKEQQVISKKPFADNVSKLYKNQFIKSIESSLVSNSFIKELYVTDYLKKQLTNSLTIQQVKIASHLSSNGKYMNSIEFRDGLKYSGNLSQYLEIVYDTEEEALAAARNDTYMFNPNDKNIHIIVNFNELEQQFKDRNIKNANLQITLSDSIFTIKNSPTISSIINTHTFLYCCSKNGKDSNNGSEEFPFKTIKKALDVSKNSTTILLNRNSIFHERVLLKKNISLNSYGDGTMPIVSGFAKIDSTTKYTRGLFNEAYSFEEHEEGKIIRFDLASVKYGGKLLDESKFNIGSLVSDKLNKVYGTKTMFCNKEEYEYNKRNRSIDNNIQRNTYLLNLYDFYQDTKNYRYLYVLLDDLDEFISSNIKISTYGNGIVMENYSEIIGLHIEGFGRHGIVPKSNSKVQSCKVSVIGGSIQPEYPTWVRLGNGIECWVSSPIENVEIIDNIIESVFDCALTVQGRVYKKTDYIKNIRIEGNKSYRCRQLFEFFYNDPNGITDMPTVENVYIRKNIGVNSGYQPFGPSEPRDGAFLHYQNKSINGIYIEENTLINSKTCLSCAVPARIKINYNNFICKKGDALWSSLDPSLNLKLLHEGNLTESGYRYPSNYNGNLSKIVGFEYSYHKSLDYCNKHIIELFKKITNSPHLNIVITNDIDYHINLVGF